ncbi:tetratricopeptide repeat protein [Rasiella rasia]|uniref:Tetratricopeptide repeat protein n=1 Tax=Rasiella rasia TaxID=2744027 RepID=A0A6G6GLK0_9FLAO|nr:tetratricopeptide repeat protein [Rasiella rasia]QIE59466.1 tetratricopeptide repeat protein [Rasiella rasia]
MNKFLIVCIVSITIAKANAQNALAIGDSLYSLGNYNAAITQYKQTTGAEDKIARAYKAVGNNAMAIQYYKKHLENEKTDVLSSYNYGKLLLSANRFKQADSLFEVLSKANPKNPEFYYQLGLAKEKQKDSIAFIKYLQALTNDKNHQNALFKVAKIQAERRNFNEAMMNIERGLKVDSESVRFLNLKALIAYVNKSYHLAADTYEKLIDLNQSNERLHENLAVSYNQTNRFEQAISQYAILINEYDDKNPSWHFSIAKNYEALRYLDKAQHHFEIAIALQDLPLDKSYVALASVYKKQKDYKNQFSVLQKAVRENSNNQRALYLLATAADNYFVDDAVVLPYYEKYLAIFGEQGNYTEHAKQRIKDLKTDIHFNKN